MLLKTNVVKMSENRPLAMLMKIDELKSLSGDVNERKGRYRPATSAEWQVASNGLGTKVGRQTERNPLMLRITVQRVTPKIANHESPITNDRKEVQS